MKPKDILRAMGQIDESLIDEALEAGGKQKEKAVKRAVMHKKDEGVYAESIIEVEKPPRSRRSIFKWAGLAACLCIMIIGVVFFSRSQLITDLNPSSSLDNSDSEGADIVLDTEEAEKTEASFETKAANENNYNVGGNNTLPPDAVLNVPPAKLKELSVKEDGYISCSEKYLSFINDNHSYFSTVSSTETDNLYLVQLIGYDFETEEETIIFGERREAHGEQDLAYTPLCVYDGYIYLRREENYSSHSVSEDWENYSKPKAAEYSIWRIKINYGVLENISDVKLAFNENICDTPVLDGYMYYESVVKFEEGGCVYNINRINLRDGFADVFMENARCPLVYNNNIVFYREGSFYQCESDNSTTLLFNAAVDFSRDRLAAAGDSILLLRHCLYADPDSSDKEAFAFTAEVYGKSGGFKPIALFNESVVGSEEFEALESAPKITAAGGRFEFMGIIFDPAENVFYSAVNGSETETERYSIIKWDDSFIYAVYDYDLSSDETGGAFRNVRVYEFYTNSRLK